MKVEVGSLGVFVDLPNIASWQEAKRISKTLFKYTVETVIPAFPPAYHGRAAKEFVRVFNRDLNHPTKPKKPYQCVKNANAALRQKYKALMNAVNGWRLPLNALYNAQQREGEARNLLLAAQRLIEETGGDMLEFYRIAGEVFINAGIKPVELKKDGSNLYPAAKRLLCKEWIERKIEVSARQHRENVAIAWGEVNKKSPYISMGGLSAYRSAIAAGEQFLSSILLVNDETEQQICLKDAAEKSAANPDIREIELNVRVDGLTEWAERKGYDSYFLTETAPSKYHYNSGSRWNGSMPRDTQAYLCETWVKARAKLAKHDIDFRGLRVVEPHKDATPHWHMLIFFKPEQAQTALEIIGNQFRKQDNQELNTPKKLKARFDVVKLKNAKHAARYVAKYISKNVSGKALSKRDGSEPFDHETGLEITSACERVKAWASFHTIRQFQFFGVKSVTLFREIRRLRVEGVNEQLQALIDATGGVKGDDKTPNWYAFEKLADRCTFIKESATTRYGELSKKIKGLLIGGERFITRVGVWRQEEMTAKRSEALLKNAEAFSWQVVNNCNPITNGQPRRVTEGLLVPVGSGNFKLRTESIE